MKIQDLWATPPQSVFPSYISSSGNILFWLFIGYICLYRFWLSSDMPYIFPMSSPHDGTWFTKKAISVFSGQWMGEYNNRTLMKGPMFSLFLASIAKVGLSPRTAVDLLYIIACLIFLKCLIELSTSKVASVFGFVLLLINPVTLSKYWEGALRQHLYLPATIIFISSLLLILIYLIRLQKFSFLWLIICSISIALAWNTREESIWMATCLLVAIVATILATPHKSLLKLTRLLFYWACILIIPALVWHNIAIKNEQYYGFYGVVDFKSKEFTRAINNILSLVTLPTDNNHHLTQESKAKLLQISKNTRELITPLLNPDLEDFARYGASVPGTVAAWAIRDSMAHSGYYQSFQQSEDQYRQVSEDIESYCKLEPDNCDPPLVFNILWQQRFNQEIISTAISSFQDILKFIHFDTANEIRAVKGGDAAWRYVVSRMFNYNGYRRIQAYEHTEGMVSVQTEELKRHRIRVDIYDFFKQNMTYLFALTLLFGSLCMIFGHQRNLYRALIFAVGTALASTFSIFVIVAISAVVIPRVLITITAPLIMSVSIVSTIVIAQIMGATSLLKSKFTNPINE